jgi:dTDP-4-dehydrorhamnose reductase
MGDEKVVILGGRGMLGSDLASTCKESFSTVVFDLPDFDITDYKQLEQVIKDASIVLNCAAYTNVDVPRVRGTLHTKSTPKP